jgi:hypothetical protein
MNKPKIAQIRKTLQREIDALNVRVFELCESDHPQIRECYLQKKACRDTLMDIIDYINGQPFIFID